MSLEQVVCDKFPEKSHNDFFVISRMQADQQFTKRFLFHKR